MNLVGNIVLNLYSVMILIIIYFQSLKQTEKDLFQYKIYMIILKMTMLLLIVDIFSRFDGKPNTVYCLINNLGNFTIFSLNLVIPSLWLLYVYDQVFQEERKIRKLFYLLVALNCVNAAIVILTQFFGWLYYIDSNNIYHRGPLYFLPVSITIFLIALANFFVIKNRMKIDKKHYITLTFFAIPPSIGIILQIMFLGISIIFNCLVFSLLIVFLNIQNNDLYTDYLTGVNNRKKLDLYLNDKIKMSKADKTFSAIMLDLNNFKSINDTWGHDAGDKALRKSIKLLHSCLGVDDFIARFGGDEFCIILDLSNQNELDDIVQKINHCFKKYNEASNQPYELMFSIGYAIYDYHSKMNIEEFQKKLDLLLYENKQQRIRL